MLCVSQRSEHPSGVSPNIAQYILCKVGYVFWYIILGGYIKRHILPNILFYKINHHTEKYPHHKFLFLQNTQGSQFSTKRCVDLCPDTSTPLYHIIIYGLSQNKIISLKENPSTLERFLYYLPRTFALLLYPWLPPTSYKKNRYWHRHSICYNRNSPKHK